MTLPFLFPFFTDSYKSVDQGSWATFGQQITENTPLFTPFELYLLLIQ